MTAGFFSCCVAEWFSTGRMPPRGSCTSQKPDCSECAALLWPNAGQSRFTWNLNSKWGKNEKSIQNLKLRHANAGWQSTSTVAASHLVMVPTQARSVSADQSCCGQLPAGGDVPQTKIKLQHNDSLVVSTLDGKVFLHRLFATLWLLHQTTG